MRTAPILVATLAVWPALAQFEVEAAGACNVEGVPAAAKAVLEADGYRVKQAGDPFVEVWLRKDIPAGTGEAAHGADFSLKPATMVGVIRYAKDGADFRGQPIKAGAYVMRYNLQPEDGDHQGASPRRDHILLSPVAADPDPDAPLTYDAAVDLSRKASGTRHPLVLFLSSPGSGAKFPSVVHHENRQILHIKSGAVAMGIVIVGKAEE
jgi:hypothetical protein